MSRSTTLDFGLLPVQRELWESRDNVVAVVTGYGGGKTEGGGKKSVQLAVENGAALGGGIGEGMIVAPTNRMLVRVTLPSFLRNAGPLVRKYNKHDGRIDLVNGGIVWLGSTDTPGSLEGSNLSWIWGDEARLWDAQGEAYNILMGRLRVREAKRLQMVLTTTPVAGTWLQREFDGNPDRRCLHASSRDNKFLADGFIDRLLETYSEAQARCYVEGQWVTLSGAVFEEFDRALHVRDYTPDPALPVIGGVDFGFRWPAAVFAQIMPTPRDGMSAGSVVVFDEIADDNMSTEALGHRIATKFPSGGKLRLEWLGCDPAGASHSSSASEHGGIMDVKALRNGLSDGGITPRLRYVRGSGASIIRSVHTGIESLRARLRNAKGITSMYFASSLDETKSYRSLLRSMQAYQYKEGTATPLKGKMANQVDHSIDALRYMDRHVKMRGPRVESYA